jgi:hypothetical protein
MVHPAEPAIYGTIYRRWTLINAKFMIPYNLLRSAMFSAHFMNSTESLQIKNTSHKRE